jgi:hypothetical protein
MQDWTMKLIFSALAATGLLFASAAAHADPGKNTPVHAIQRYIQRHGSMPGHLGASGHRPAI